MGLIVILLIFGFIGYLIYKYIKQPKNIIDTKDTILSNNPYKSLFIVCFVIPFFGFLSGVIHIDNNNMLARACMKYAVYGILAEIIITVIIIICSEM